MLKTATMIGSLLFATGFSQSAPTPGLPQVAPTNVMVGQANGVIELRPTSGPAANGPDSFATVRGVDFHNGEISLEVSADRIAGAPESVRAFVGVAFRSDGPRYEAFYVRMYNGRAPDQLQRNHSAQYISHPDWPWERLRKETPGLFETYVDLLPNRWTRMRVKVCDGQARLFVDGATQPTLVVRQLKLGAQASGGVALWVGPGTVGRFRALKVTAAGNCPLSDSQ